MNLNNGNPRLAAVKKLSGAAIVILLLVCGTWAAAMAPDTGTSATQRTAVAKVTTDETHAKAVAGRLRALFERKGIYNRMPRPVGTQLETLMADRGGLKASRRADATIYSDAQWGVIAVEGPDGGGKALEAAKGTRDAETVARDYVTRNTKMFGLKDQAAELELEDTETDDLGMTHVKFRQLLDGVPVWGRQLFAHVDKGGALKSINCLLAPNTEAQAQAAGSLLRVGADLLPAGEALGIAETRMRELGVWDPAPEELARQLDYEDPEAVLYYWQAGPALPLRLVWAVEIRPNLLDHYRLFIDARGGEILELYNNTMSQAAQGSGTDLNGQNRALELYNSNGTYYMTDITRPMFQAGQADNVLTTLNAAGVVNTWDMQNTEPGETANPAPSTSNNPTLWNDSVKVSAHANAGLVYEYFRTVHGRNSYDDKGDSLVSLVHTTSMGQPMDNAFWNGRAMFYGDGNGAFTPLAGSLDVAAHEMAHGVIGTSANLEYRFQSGALNESFADVFGIMLDRDNFLLGEDVVVPSVFTSGALRDMLNPNQGLAPNENGWQPAHMAEFQNLTLEQDNGGVHVNSGIPNRACALLVQAIGHEKTEQIYYRALTVYLMQQSQFVDARLALIRSAGDLYGVDSPEQNAMRNAYDAVGILEGTSTPPPVDSQPVPGPEFVVCASSTDGSPYLVDFGAGSVYPISFFTSSLNFGSGRPIAPSLDGSVILFVDSAFALRALSYIEASNQWFEEIVDNTVPYWSIAVSPDGTKVAYTLQNSDNSIRIFNLTNSQLTTIPLYYPTTQEDLFLDMVVFADSMVWADNNFLIFDMLNRPNPNNLAQDFWDIGVLDTSTGGIYRVLSPLAEGFSLGNPILASTNNSVMAVEIVDNGFTNFNLVGFDLFSGTVNTIFSNGPHIHYADYSVNDSTIVFRRFDGFDPNFGQVANLYTLPMAADKISAAGAPGLFITGADYPVWFSQGTPPPPPPTPTPTPTVTPTPIPTPTPTPEPENRVRHWEDYR